MVAGRRGRRGLAVAGCSALLGVLALTGCAEQSGGSDASGGGGSSSGEGVEFGASMEEYAEALADVDPITINAQSPSPEGSVTGAKFEGYMNAVEEWSDGKITFNVGYSNAIAPPVEVDNALTDGRLDLGSVVLALEPQEYPANAAFTTATVSGPNGPLAGTLVSNTWWLDTAYNSQEMLQETEDAGFTMLMPAFNSGLITLMCAEQRTSLEDYQGVQLVAGNQAQNRATESLGATPISLAYPEIFEALQRGVADCSMNSLLVGQLGGFTEAVPHVIADPDAGFGSGQGGWAFSNTAWESYPLVVQQLLFDRLDAFMLSNFESIFETVETSVDAVNGAGGSFSEFDEDAEQAVQETNEGILDELRANSAVGDGDAFVDYMLESIERWEDRITGELGFEEVAYEEFADFYEPGELDLQPLVDAVFEEILLEHRPS